jgi:cbb3-type cytochrome oxidase maturation protein
MIKSIIILIILSLCIGTAAWLFFIWTVKRGDFDDVEGPKYRMLDDDEDNSSQPDASRGEKK